MPSTSSSPLQHGASASVAALPPIVTDGIGKRTTSQLASTLARDRLSTYSNTSFASQNRSRPGSHVFPIFHSSLPYTLVRDFAYPVTHPLHYGPPPNRASTLSSPASEQQRRLSDPPGTWDGWRGHWSAGPWAAESGQGHQHLPAMSFGDGPPYSEDEDLHSPVVTMSRHRKYKSTGIDMMLNGQGAARSSNQGYQYRSSVYFTQDADRGTLVSTNADGSETYYVDDDDAADDGPGGEYVTYPASESRYSQIDQDPSYSAYDGPPSHGHEAGFESEEEEEEEEEEARGEAGGGRYSRDYQFAVGCPDEEMHGKAVALFDFTREHENELPLTEGQVILVSYRHGQGWLVAEDPKTGESGLVPEEFVRLLRDIEGGLTSLNDDTSSDMLGTNTYLSPDSTDSDQALTPTQSDRLPMMDSYSNDPQVCDTSYFPLDNFLSPANTRGKE
ncbi:hypothetical protein ASPZODRAFT_158988 [Penicilliopsis zonata CBS 506.65]|uniref:SH3 domain-containing protein n=1 Tax=Penicilliopsis zonata CBS 506.65 TaxID=1073090 RepID=A0A1L9SIS3_9EURO|nr:hypothetical protein ASPZODRAFT_158988 [Penicilliopsis zonata CBS 506.65]OJJ46983.1 hypothetical protein ASPZODRAFT_158988 [Penicilliopsis zonata CBS 506.65]